MASDAVTVHRRALRLEWFTVSWNVLETGIALTAGLLAGSTALVGFGVDSAIEVSSAVALLWRLHRAGPSAHVEERSKAERRALYFVAGTFIALGAYVAWSAGRALLGRQAPDTSLVGLGLAAASLIVMPLLAFAKQRTARQMRSRALEADAMETWVCAYLSVALLIGLGLYAWLDWWWADPVGALLMEPVILWQAWDTFEEARSTG